MTPAPTTEAGRRRSGDRVVLSLTAAVFLQWLGASAILPLLPVYLRGKGGTDTLVGLTMASFFAAGLLFQYPAGRLADRIGRRPVLVGGLVVYAAASLGFLAPVSATADIGLRALQGAGAGAAEVSALAMVAGAVAIERRGRAFGSIYGGQLAGMAVGPLLGSLLGVGSMNLIFVAAAAASLLASIPVLTGTEVARHGAAGHGALRHRLVLTRSMTGALMAAAAMGLAIGVYEACWTLLLDGRGATSWEVGLSWTLFAVPFVVMARPAGWLADHLDRRVLAIVAVAFSLAFCATYPFVQSLAWLLGMGAVEALGVAVALPASQSLLTQGSPAGQLGRVQGLFTTSETAAIALSAAASGYLFSLHVWLPFVAAAVLGGVLVALLPVVWGPVAGRVPRPEPVGERDHQPVPG